jgi:hypothetical protein
MSPVPCDRNTQDRCQTRHRHVFVVGFMDISQATQWRLATLAAHRLDAQPHQPTRTRPLWLVAPTDIPKVTNKPAGSVKYLGVNSSNTQVRWAVSSSWVSTCNWQVRLQCQVDLQLASGLGVYLQLAGPLAVAPL